MKIYLNVDDQTGVEGPIEAEPVDIGFPPPHRAACHVIPATEPWYCITHVESGLRIGQGYTKEQAILSAKVVLKKERKRGEEELLCTLNTKAEFFQKRLQELGLNLTTPDLTPDTARDVVAPLSLPDLDQYYTKPKTP